MLNIIAHGGYSNYSDYNKINCIKILLPLQFITVYSVSLVSSKIGMKYAKMNTVKKNKTIIVLSGLMAQGTES